MDGTLFEIVHAKTKCNPKKDIFLSLRFRIKIINPIKELLDRYSNKSSPYLLPIIDCAVSDERKQYETALRRINNTLKHVADMVKLPVTLTTYVSRHTWATIAKSKNVPINVKIMQ